MKIPKWVPQVPRPFNPAYREVWDVMSPNERRASFSSTLPGEAVAPLPEAYR